MLSILIVFLVFKTTNAAQVIGADIYYSTNKNNTVDVFVKRYKLKYDKDTNTITIGFEVGGYKATQKATKIYTKDLSNFCSSYKNTNQNSFNDTKVDLYKTTFDMSDNTIQTFIQINCQVKFFYFDTERISSITTVNIGKKFYVEAMANLCVLDNQVIYPEFGNNPFFSLCCNQPMVYNFGYVNQPAIIDSFSFELTNVKDSTNRNLTYVGNFTKKIPMTPYCPPNPGVINCRALPNAKPPRGIFFDEMTGDLMFTPTNCQEIGVIVVKINLYKLDKNNLMQNIGYITREMTIIVDLCTDNNPPQITNTTNKFKVCEGDKFCYQYNTSDNPYLPNQKNYDSTSFYYLNQNITGVKFTILDSNAREKSANLCFNTKYGDYKKAPYHFTIKANDNNCPLTGIASRGVLISVLTNPTLGKKSYRFLDCNQIEVKIEKHTPNLSNKWELLNQSKQLIASGIGILDTLQLIKPYSAIYYMKCTNNFNNCGLIDTIKNDKFDRDYEYLIDTTICQINSTLKLDNYNIYKNKTAKWYTIYDSLIPNHTIDYKNATFPHTINAVYKLTIQTDCNIKGVFNFTINDTMRKYLDKIEICDKTDSVNLFQNGIYKRTNGIWVTYPNTTINKLGYIKDLSNINSCRIKYYYDSGYCTNYEYLTLNVEKQVKANFKADKTIGTPSLLVSFTNQTIGTNLKYKWNFGDKYSPSNSSIILNPAHYYDSIGKYSVSLITKGNVCIDTLTKIDYIEVKAKNLGVKGLSIEDLVIKVYPNPSNGIINIETDKNFTLTITDITGKTILQTENKKQIELPKGAYFMKFEVNNSFVVEKIIIY